MRVRVRVRAADEDRGVCERGSVERWVPTDIRLVMPSSAAVL